MIFTSFALSTAFGATAPGIKNKIASAIVAAFGLLAFAAGLYLIA